MGREMVYIVPPEYGGKKLIAFLRGYVGISARNAPKLKADPEGLKRNGAHIRTIDRVNAGDEIRIRMPEEASVIVPTAPKDLDIVYEDEDVLIVNKPGTLAIHPTHNHQGDTLANQVAGYLAVQGKQGVFRAVGRLDKTTSGLVVCALNKHAAFRLAGNYEKEYLALAGGAFTGKGTIDKPIYRPDPNKTLRAAGETGERAVTHWESIGTNGEFSLLRVRLETGRTHQIRVHFMSLGAPLLGDEMYGGDTSLISRAALHCETVTLTHPVTGERLRFSAPPPEDMQKLISMLNK